MTPWIQIANGKPFEPLRCSPDEITIEVIAASLSKLCRFNGHTKRFYSVAEHSYHVMTLLPPHLQLAGLLHDAHEAYTGFGDIATPMKTAYQKQVECFLDDVIARAFGFSAELFYTERVKYADLKMLSTEKRDLLLPCEREWEIYLPEPADIKLNEIEFSYHAVEGNFLRMFSDLMKRKESDTVSSMES